MHSILSFCTNTCVLLCDLFLNLANWTLLMTGLIGIIPTNTKVEGLFEIA
jgi:hypothetical protein